MNNTCVAPDYSDDSFWNKVGKFAKKAGSELIETAIAMWEAMKDDDTPVWAKGTILGALVYFISPIDAIPDVIPFAGFTDDLGVLTAALATVRCHVKERHWQFAKDKLDQWFG